MGGGLSPSRPSRREEEDEEDLGVVAAPAGAAVQGGEEAAGARKRTQQERSPARAGMASSKRRADDVTRADDSQEMEREGEEVGGRQLFSIDREGDWSGTGGGSRTPPPIGALAADSSATAIGATRVLQREGTSSPAVVRDAPDVQDSSGQMESREGEATEDEQAKLMVSLAAERAKPGCSGGRAWRDLQKLAGRRCTGG